MATVIRRGGLVLQSVCLRSSVKVLCIRGSPAVLAPRRVPWKPHVRCFASETEKAQTTKSTETSEVTAVVETAKFREHFIPITRRSVIRHLMQEKNFLTHEELNKFEQFSLALDSAIVNKYHGILQELKSLFDPINPDKDTITTRQWNRRERLDNEFWLIQKLGAIMEKANFRELPRSMVEKALSEHQAGEGVLVSVETGKYDVLRFWALGREALPQKLALKDRLVALVSRKKPGSTMDFYKRVVVAVRLKTDDKLLLKAFKEVPVNALEQLLPDGKIKMTKFDHGLMTMSTSIAIGGILAKIVTYLAHVQVDWTLLLAGVTGLVGFRAFSSYKNRRNRYLLELNRMLYFKNIANNRGLLALLVDRAEDELFKECLLVYTFLLTNRPPSVQAKGSSEKLPAELGSVHKTLLENNIQDWVLRKTRSKIQFQSNEAIRVLSELGLISEDDENNLHVLPIEGALRNLPISPQTFATRKEEYDIIEGYETHIVEESDDDYKVEQKKRKKFGWF